jgi:FkbM family methyltransferase
VIKTLFQQTLRRLGLYVWFKEETLAYDIYRRFKDGRPVNWRARELRFYRGLLGLPGGDFLIFDVGANRGQRTEVFVRLGARVVAIEPDETNQRLLARKFKSRPVAVVGKAASDGVGAVTLRVAHPGSGLNTLSEKWVRTLRDNPGKLGAHVEYEGSRTVQTTTLALLIEAHGTPRYIKIDVEGHEPGVLRGLAAAVPFVSFEAILPEFRPEAAECIEILGRLSPRGRFNYSEDCHKGLALGEWLDGPGIATVLDGLGEKTIEVYWRRD